jgi:uncharacterized protein YbjT (DUF2867 family)
MTSVLIIGGHGKVGLLAAPKLVERGFQVTSLIRNPDQSADIEALGATPLVRDVTGVTPEEWDTLLADFDVVVWSAGAGGGSAERTYSIDRDAALAVVDSLERLRDAGRAPRYLNVSYLGATTHSVPEDDSFFPYADSKKIVDDRLNATTGLDYVILGPSALTLEPASGFAVPTADLAREDSHTSRDLVAEVITELAGRDRLPADHTIEFVDGDRPVSEI